MKIKQFKQVEDVVKALQEDLNPILDEIGNLNEVVKALQEKNAISPLTALATRLTKTSRRHNLEKPLQLLDEGEYIIGTNHNGIGYQNKYSSQLSNLGASHYGNDEKRLRAILFDSDSVIEIVSIIKKSNQKTFLKAISILNKHKIENPFGSFKEDNFNVIEVKIEDEKYNIKIDFIMNYSISISVNKDEEEIGEIDFRIDDGKLILNMNDEDDELFKKISDKRYPKLKINELKTGFFVSQHKDEIIKALNGKKELLESVTDNYEEEYKELNELLEPFLTFEKL